MWLSSHIILIVGDAVVIVVDMSLKNIWNRNEISTPTYLNNSHLVFNQNHNDNKFMENWRKTKQLEKETNKQQQKTIMQSLKSCVTFKSLYRTSVCPSVHQMLSRSYWDIYCFQQSNLYNNNVPQCNVLLCCVVFAVAAAVLATLCSISNHDQLSLVGLEILKDCKWSERKSKTNKQQNAQTIDLFNQNPLSPISLIVVTFEWHRHAIRVVYYLTASATTLMLTVMTPPLLGYTDLGWYCL